VNLDDSHLRERHDSADRLGDEILAHLGLFLDVHSAKRRRSPGLCVPEEPARSGDALGAMDERQRTAADVRHDPLGDVCVVLCKLLLGDAELRIDEPVRM
jgi:hypothetical protein